ncbi:MAG: hypothetical protein LBR73_00310 [Oscillospiraceae bacterium]|jgi:hypothetical protein|nr:hypothetical protein [Oscillospiraceae bacterium]
MSASVLAEKESVRTIAFRPAAAGTALRPLPISSLEVIPKVTPKPKHTDTVLTRKKEKAAHAWKRFAIRAVAIAIGVSGAFSAVIACKEYNDANVRLLAAQKELARQQSIGETLTASLQSKYAPYILEDFADKQLHVVPFEPNLMHVIDTAAEAD